MSKKTGEFTEKPEEYDYRTFEGSLCGVHLSHMTVKMVRPGEDRERAQTTNTICTKTQELIGTHLHVN